MSNEWISIVLKENAAWGIKDGTTIVLRISGILIADTKTIFLEAPEGLAFGSETIVLVQDKMLLRIDEAGAKQLSFDGQVGDGFLMVDARAKVGVKTFEFVIDPLHVQ